MLSTMLSLIVLTLDYLHEILAIWAKAKADPNSNILDLFRAKSLWFI